MNEDMLKSLKELAAWDFIPKAMIVCVLGNLINFVILSRTCIKSSTNIFLSILALVDTFFMLFIYVYSKRYHDDVYDQTYEIYWRMFGLSHWFYTAFLYVTVYLTLSLTLDRYAAMRHPNRTKCGVARAKNVVSMVLFACIFFTVSSAFEFQLVSDEYKNHELCKNTSNRSQVAENTTMTMSATMTAAEMSPANDYESSLNLLEFDYSSYNFNEDDSRLKRSLDNDVFSDGISSTNDTEDYSELSYKTSYNPADVDHYVNDAERDNAPSQVIPKRNHDTCSHFYLYPVDSSLAKNTFYRAIFKPIASILLMMPVGLILVLACMLSASVRRVNKVRQALARLPASTERPAKTQTDVLIRENKLTVLVIAVVVIFLICHIPNAVYLLFKSWWNIRQTFTSDKQIKNFILSMEILCQILMSINCCSKIFIYLLAYDDYWTSLRSLKNCFQTTSNSGEQIINTSKHLFPSTKADVESLLNYSLNKKRYSTQIPPEARHHQYQISVQRAQKPSFTYSTSTNSITPCLSLTTFDAGGIEMNRRTSTFQVQAERHPHTSSNRTLDPGLHLSPSQVSLTRSKSLNIQSTMKHSPNCRLNKKF